MTAFIIANLALALERNDIADTIRAYARSI